MKLKNLGLSIKTLSSCAVINVCAALGATSAYADVAHNGVKANLVNADFQNNPIVKNNYDPLRILQIQNEMAKLKSEMENILKNSDFKDPLNQLVYENLVSKYSEKEQLLQLMQEPISEPGLIKALSEIQVKINGLFQLWREFKRSSRITAI